MVNRISRARVLSEGTLSGAVKYRVIMDEPPVKYGPGHDLGEASLYRRSLIRSIDVTLPGISSRHNGITKILREYQDTARQVVPGTSRANDRLQQIIRNCLVLLSKNKITGVARLRRELLRIQIRIQRKTSDQVRQWLFPSRAAITRGDVGFSVSTVHGSVSDARVFEIVRADAKTPLEHNKNEPNFYGECVAAFHRSGLDQNSLRTRLYLLAAKHVVRDKQPAFVTNHLRRFSCLFDDSATKFISRAVAERFFLLLGEEFRSEQIQ